MKWGYFLMIIGVFLLHAAKAQKQEDTVFHISSLPAKGILLNHYWIFHPGDDTNYAHYNYIGNKGIAVNPAVLLDELPDVERSGIGWFCLKLQVDSSLRNRTVGIMLSLLGAAEIYLNGVKIYRFGEVSPFYAKERTQAIYGKAISLLLGKDEKQILAVRYSHNPANLYIKSGSAPYCLRMIMFPLNETINHYAVLVKQAYRFTSIALTIEFASALLTLIFFFSFPSRKEYLYFGIYFILNFLGILIQSDLGAVGEPEQITIDQLGIIQILMYVFLIIGTLFHLNAMYTLLQIRRTRYYRFLLAYAVTSMIALPFLRKEASTLPDLFFPLCCFELLAQYYKAGRRKFRGAWILFSSIALCLLFLAVLIKINIEKQPDLITTVVALIFLSSASGIVIFLAIDFARTSNSLKSRVAEVESLSHKTLEQEREKQQILANQKEQLEMEVQHRTSELRKSLTDLKATQRQLIQSEKMASLGELTSGIAHELQNPLNFINNFSDVNSELIAELRNEINKGNMESAFTILEDIKENEQKVNLHGKRADIIVKNMMQHSRPSSGIKEPADINALAEDFMQLSYHNIRSKDKNFFARLEMDLDENMGSIYIIPQDIGRVMLNLYNNAFYAVNEKKKHTANSFEPTVSVCTKRFDNKIQVTVKDNGIGIPEKMINKIYQPFFTTKPTGQGTGLGLSISYNIIKAHGGELIVQSKEGEGSTFTFELNTN